MTAVAINLEARIRAAYHVNANQAGDPVSLTDLRITLGDDLPRNEVDQALRNMDGGDVFIYPEAAQWLLTDEDRAAAVVFGGEPSHLIQIS